jgi:type 1 glutamine amidotransferase
MWVRPTVLIPAIALASLSAAAQERLLVFTKTAGYRHDSIPAAVELLNRLAAAEGVTVDHTEDATAFMPDNLARYRAISFANTTGDILDENQQTAMERFIRAGGGFLGIHAAADTEYDWPWYGRLVGAWFEAHPPGLQTGRLVFEPDGRDATVTDEFYDFRANPRPWVRVIARLDPASYDGHRMGADHPIAWCHAVDAGRSWYIGLGHGVAVYSLPLFQAHLAGGLRFALGRTEAC